MQYLSSLRSGGSRAEVAEASLTFERCDGQRSHHKLEWSPSEGADAVRERLESARSSDPAFSEQAVHVAAELLLAGADQEGDAPLRLLLRPELRSASLIELRASRSAGGPSSVWSSSQPSRPSLGACALLPDLLALPSVRKLKANETSLGLLTECSHLWSSLTSLDLSGSNLAAVPEVIGRLHRLQRLHVDRNKLSSVPRAVESLHNLVELTADSNAIASATHELAHCTKLRRVSLENNKLASPPGDLPTLVRLEELHLSNNPLESMPDILHCTKLVHLSLMGVSLRYDWHFNAVTITTGDSLQSSSSSFLQTFRYTSGSSSSSYLVDTWTHFCSLVFKHTACQHTIIASTVKQMCDTKPGREAVMRADGALAQLLAMAVSETWKVTREACAALQQLAQDPHCARKMVEVNALESILSLLSSSKEALQESGLDLLSAIAYASQHASAELLSSGLLDKLHTTILRGGRCAACAMRALGDLAFERGNSQIISNHTELRMQLEREADRAVMTKPMRSQALRVLAIIGENRAVDRSLGNSDGPYRRGVRILSMDGGGMKGLATLKMLERIERGTGRRIHELFDMIGGTSTGGILAFSMGVRRMTLQQCREIYTTLSKNVFKKSNREENPSWRDHISSLYASGTQSVRFAVKGSKHDAAEFEALLRERCIVQGKEIPLVDAGLHSGPRVFAMATRVSVIPAEPFVFRTYAHSPHADKSPLRGTCRNLVWHGVRASSAAPYYLADFAVDGERWQDGGVSCNNPSVVAVQEARCVWPDCDIDCIISLGSGEPPTKEREVSSISRYIDAGTALVESACSVDRADDALQTLCPLLPGCTYYRFQPINDACNIELDDNDDGLLKALEEAASSYIASEEARFEAACSHLLSGRAAGTDPSRNTSSSPRSQARLPSITSPRASRRSEEPEGIAHAAGGAHCNLSEPVQREECELEDVVHTLQTGSDGRQRRPRSLLLGLHACQDGLVLSWKRTAIALTDADALSARLLHGAGAKSLSGLPSEFLAQTDCENSVNSTDLFRAVSASSVLGTQHQRLNTAVVERCDPDDVLDRQRVVQNRFTWQGLAIALASAAPLSLVHSLLEVGARLVAMVSSLRNSDTYTWSELRAAFDDVLGHADDDPVAALSQHPCSSQLCLYARKHGDIVRLA